MGRVSNAKVAPNLMKHILSLTMACGILLSGCIAGPTPHPSTNEDNVASSQDGSATTPSPGSGEGSCEESGGFWDGSECMEGLNGAADATSVMDSEDEQSNDVEDDALEDDSVEDAPQPDVTSQDAS